MSGMPFQQDIDSARAETVGNHGIAKALLDDTLRRSEAALVWLRKAHAEESLPLLRLPARTDDLDGIERAAARLRTGATDVVVLGTGGSRLASANCSSASARG